jgi:FkbM family methyltransferase
MKKIFVILTLISINQIRPQYLQPYFPYYSQAGQDKFVNENIFKDKKKGVFVDVGAHDGISYSNSYYFEKENEWTGICVEPHPTIFPQLIKNRKATCFQVCIGNAEGLVDFMKVDGAAEMLSGMTHGLDPRHLARINNEINALGGLASVIKVPIRTLSSLLKEINLLEIDFLSVDVEGGEMEVIQGIDFDSIKIKCILIENAYPDKFQVIRDLLLSKNYQHFASLSFDEVFVLNE